MSYPKDFDPYDWHWDERKQNYWRVISGYAEHRLELINELQKLNEDMEQRSSFADVDRWHQLKNAILACEEVKK